jgi:Ca-activated chloride channel family protein
VEHLTAANFREIQYGRAKEEVKQAITQLGLDFRLMTQFTSFVAVEDKVVNEGGQSRRVEIPVEMPEGVSYEGVYGEPKMAKSMAYRGAGVGFAGGVMSTMDSANNAPVSPQPVPIQREQIRIRPAILKDKAEQGPADVMSKVHTSLQTLQPGTMVRVQVWLVNADALVVAKLKAAGLSVESASGSLVTGRVDAAKLAVLAALSEVRLISPVPVR